MTKPLRLTERQRRAVSRLLRAEHGHMPMDRALARQLARRGVVVLTDHVAARTAWGEVVARLPVVQLVLDRALAQALVEAGR